MLKTNRSLLVYILLNIITLGIYSLFFYHQLAIDMNIACQGDGKKTQGLLMYILLSLVTCGIYSLIWHYGVCERIAMNCHRRNAYAPVDGGKFLLWYLLGALLRGIGPFVGMHLMLKGVNEVCAAHNANPNGSAHNSTPVVNVNINQGQGQF